MRRSCATSATRRTSRCAWTRTRAARAHGMLVMVGCMIETSLGITAAAHFTPLVDAADLDGAALTANDPFIGATIEGGQIRLPIEPGLGVRRRSGRAGNG